MTCCQNCENPECVTNELERLENEIRNMKSRGYNQIPRLQAEIERKLEKCKKMANGLSQDDVHYVTKSIRVADNPELPIDYRTDWLRDAARIMRDNVLPSREYPEPLIHIHPLINSSPTISELYYLQKALETRSDSEPQRRFFPEKRDIHYTYSGFDRIQIERKNGEVIRSFAEPNIEEPPVERTSTAYCSESCQNILCPRRRDENFGKECIYNNLMR